jgi:hypothetical protein
VKVNAVYVLLFVAVASPLLALLSTGQDPAAVDWTKEVERACTSSRYGMRLAASRKVAAAGAAAVPAIRAFATAKGLNEVPSNLVAALADDAPNDPPVLELLRDWATTPNFYWRSEAMRGLALRAPKLGDPARGELGKLFAAHYGDAAWLTRVHARLGGVLLGDANAGKVDETDPRARAKQAMLLLQHTRELPLQALLDALADQRSFLEDPWGTRLGAEVLKALKAWLGDAYPLAPGDAFADTESALQLLTAACTKKSGQQLTVPAVKRDPATKFAGGFELLSCQFGDQFVQWTANGDVHVGLDATKVVGVPADAWQALETERRTLALPGAMGNVVCDNVRLRWEEPLAHGKAAPASLPAPVAAWLEHLVRSIEQAGGQDLARSLRVGLAQFAPR